MTVLYLEQAAERGNLTQWCEQLTRDSGGAVQYLALPDHVFHEDTGAAISLQASARVGTSYRLMQWLLVREMQFALVLLHDWLGAGFYVQVTCNNHSLHRFMRCTVHEAAGPVPQHAVCRRAALAQLVGRRRLQRPARHHWFPSHAHLMCPFVTDFLEIDFMERQSAAHADAVFSPSRYIVDWLVDAGWQLPHVTVLPNPIVSTLHQIEPITHATHIRHIIFFGRLEARKGLAVFLAALAALRCAFYKSPAL